MLSPPGISIDDTGEVCVNLKKRGTRVYVKQKDSFGLLESYVELQPRDFQSIVSFFSSHSPGVDPFALAERINETELQTVWLTDNFPKIELDEFYRLIHLYQHFCKGLVKPGVVTYGSNLEVGTLLFYNEVRKEIRFVLPTQAVRPALWEWDIKNNKPLVFLDPTLNKPEGSFYTLAELNGDGWHMIGTSHSHNVLPSKWSGTDFVDQAGTKDAPKPPMLHVLVYQMANYLGEDLPQVKVLPSVSNFGNLLDFELDDIFSSQELETLDYKQVAWVGETIAEKLAKRWVAPVVNYGGANNPYKLWSTQYNKTTTAPTPTVQPQPQRQLPPAHDPYHDPFYTRDYLEGEYVDYFAAKSNLGDTLLDIEADAVNSLGYLEMAELIGYLIDDLYKKAEKEIAFEDLLMEISQCSSVVTHWIEDVPVPEDVV